MAEDRDFLNQLLETFAQELQEHLHALNGCFLELERQPESARRRALLDEAFREAHSLKGAARAVSFSAIAGVAERVEDILGALRRGALTLESEQFDLLYQALDLLPALFSAERAGQIPPEALPLLLSRLDALAGGGGGAAETRSPTETGSPGVAPLGAPPQPSPELPPAPASPEPEPRSPAPEPRPSAQEPQPAEPPDAPFSPLPEDTVRLPASRLDTLLARAGELVASRVRSERRRAELGEIAMQVHAWRQDWNQTRPVYSRLTRHRTPADRDLGEILEFVDRSQDRLRSLAGLVGRLLREMARDATDADALLNELHDEVRRLRMVPVRSLFSLFPRLVRDAARAAGKEVLFQVEGWETEIDRQVLQEIKDPVMHLLRNAVDHGIEDAAARQRRGKPTAGRITLRAAARNGSVAIEVEDDGAGIDPQRVRAAAADLGLVPPAVLQGMTDRDVVSLVFRPGLSTNRAVTDLSGRGVGLDVVRDRVTRLGGLVDLVSVPEQGTRFILSLPLTVLTTYVLLVRCSGQLWAIPSVAVDRTLRFQRADVQSLSGRPVVQRDGQALPVVALADVLGLPFRGEEHAGWLVGVVLEVGGERMLFTVDGLIREQEVVVKRLRWPLTRNRYLSGGAILEDGSVALVVNPAGLLAAARGGSPRLLAEPTPQRPAPEHPPTILVVDDSITTRTLEKNILETAGFSVVVAADGIEALDALRLEPVDLVVADVDMPRLDGFELTSRIRGDPQLRDLPVILVTSLESAEHRQRGLDVGANVYLPKSTFDQRQLLETIQALIG